MRKQQCQHRFNTSTITICNRHVSPRRSTNSRLQIPPYGLHADRLGPVHLLLVKLSQNAHYEEAWSVLRQSVVNCVQHRMQNLNSDVGIDVPTARHPCRDLASRARTVCEPDATLYGRSLGTNPSDARCTHLVRGKRSCTTAPRSHKDLGRAANRKLLARLKMPIFNIRA